ncbi:MAG: hypothetical protein F2842_05755 [Actinobacteria bacterium]|uniref:Unannotated protein n=1 Tax=freshwater metagenome TaxID=449393 RepID=A0A6J7JR79_9ZZZZ|nr:hypothetical protein [Actinomycetota bacterium]MSW41697.1 hypothetical protein [Actinomycetota bacterium]
MDTTELTPQERRFESERIHASPTVLLLAAIGLAGYGVGKLLGSSIPGAAHSSLGSTLAFVGIAVVVLALVLHVDHLSYRIGRSAVVLMILGAIANGVGGLLGALNASRTSVMWAYGPAFVIGGVGLAMVAVHKEGQMKATLAEYAAGAPWQVRVTVHASFLSLISGAAGLVLFGIGLIGSASDSGRTSSVLVCVGGVLVAIGVISHVEHLVPRIGLAAVIAAILAPLVWAANVIPTVVDPTDVGSYARFGYWCVGIAGLLAALACALAFHKKISTDR